MRGIIVNVVLAEKLPATAFTMCGPFGPAGALKDAVPVPELDDVNLVITVSSNLIQTVTPAGKPETVTLIIVSTRPVVGEIVIEGVTAPEKTALLVAVGGTVAGAFVEVGEGVLVAVSVGAVVAVGVAVDSMAVGSDAIASGVAGPAVSGVASCACAENMVCPRMSEISVRPTKSRL
jgi:hypothetical protein